MNLLSRWCKERERERVPSMTKESSIEDNNDLREFGAKLSVIAAPLREVPWPLPAVWLRGLGGTHVAQTLRFSRFNTWPSRQLAFKAFLAQIRALLRVWRTCVLQTSVFIEWIGSWVSLIPKICSFIALCVCALFENRCKCPLKVKIVCSKRHFWTSRCSFVVLSKHIVKSMLSNTSKRTLPKARSRIL